jgi:transposase-like protein
MDAIHPGKGKRIAPAHRRLIEAEIASGAAASQICKRWGISHNTFYRFRISLGLPEGRRRRKKLHPSQVAALNADLDAGLLTVAELAEKYGLHRNAVKWRAKRMRPSEEETAPDWAGWTAEAEAQYAEEMSALMLQSDIYTLIDGGMTVAEVADQTGQPACLVLLMANCPVGWTGNEKYEGRGY